MGTFQIGKVRAARRYRARARYWLLALALAVGCTHAENDLFGDPVAGSGAPGTGASSSAAAAGGESGVTNGPGPMSQGGSAGTSSAGTSPGGSATGGSAAAAGAAGDGGAPAADDSGGAGGSTETAAGGEGGSGPKEPCIASGVELCDGIDNDCNDAIDDEDVCPTNCHGFSDEGHSYLVCVPLAPNATTFANAQKACTEYDATFDLVRIDSAEENEFLVRSATSLSFSLYYLLWIGASDAADENEWLWMDGTQFYDHDTHTPVEGAYVNWDIGKPNNEGGNENCGMIVMGATVNLGTWNDIDCDRTDAGFICEGP